MKLLSFEEFLEQDCMAVTAYRLIAQSGVLALGFDLGLHAT